EKMVGDRVPLSGFVDGFLAKRFVYTGWADHTASWWALKDRPNVLVTFFEEMKADLSSIVEQVAEFLDVYLTADQFEKVVHKASYTTMKANNHKFSPPTPPDYAEQGRISMIRSGQAGEAEHALTAEQRLAIDQYCLAELAQLKSDFPYQESYQ
ncbi:MAG: sulfotransferase domain-containing protein, partial [Chloroflexota bacterium]